MPHVRDFKDWIQTRSGKRFEMFDPTPDMIDIVDVGHALANLCRYTGHCASFYSVAEHSVRVSFRCEELAKEAYDRVEKKLPEWMRYAARGSVIRAAARWGLLHDAAEAYVNDLNRPLKHQPELSNYREIEKRIMLSIAAKFRLGPEPDCVGIADDELLWTEVRDIMQPIHPDWARTAKTVREPLAHVQIACWSPDKARTMFFKRFGELFPRWTP